MAIQSLSSLILVANEDELGFNELEYRLINFYNAKPTSVTHVFINMLTLPLTPKKEALANHLINKGFFSLLVIPLGFLF